MEVFDKDGNAIEASAIESYAKDTLGLRTQDEINGAVAAAKNKVASASDAKLAEVTAKLEAMEKAQAAAATTQNDGDSEMMKAVKLQMENLQKQNELLQKTMADQALQTKKANLQAEIAQAASGKFISDKAALALINASHVKTDENGDFFYVDGNGGALDSAEGLVDYMMKANPELAKSSALPGAGGTSAAPGGVKAKYDSLDAVLADYDAFAAAGKLDDMNKLANEFITKSAADKPVNKGVAMLNAGIGGI